jgi:cytochrome b6
MLRAAPSYSISPFYWLGALTVVAFVIQGITGMLMMLYYVPDPSQAYSSTLYIFQGVSYGRFLETVHLYTAYAMIMLAFMHMMRGYFVSVHKKPREAMWMVGMVMGFVTLGFGFTGYLLPWTVVSKSATDVGIGILGALPQPLSSFLNFLVSGAGGDSTELLRFYDLHVVVLPAVLLVLLAVKMYMLEAHGVSEPTGGLASLDEKKKLVPIFPDVSFYLFELAALFGAAMLLISVAFPLNLPPQYTPALAATSTPQPDWYFLWVYQVLKLSVFEGAGLSVALTLVTLVFAALFLLPFIDRGETRRIGRRPGFVTLGVIFVAEITMLTIWGYLTPGRVIPDEQGALVLGGTALLIALASVATQRLLSWGLTKAGVPRSPAPSAAVRSAGWLSLRAAGLFVVLLTIGTFAIGGMINGAVGLIGGGPMSGGLWSLGLSSVGLGLAVVGTMYLLYRLDLGSGSIKRRIRALEMR